MSESADRAPKSVGARFQEAGASFEEPVDAPELHAPVKPDGFEGLTNGLALLEQAADACRSYATAPLIRDGFGNDHGSRNEWFRGIDAELSAIGRSNKLLADPMSSVIGFLKLLVKALDRDNVHTPQAKEVRRLYREIPHAIVGRYSLLDLQEKEHAANALDIISRSFLRTVTGVGT